MAQSSQQGITLMELIVVCAIGSIVTGGLIMLWFNINRSSAMTVSHAEARDIARDGVARLVREIRDAEVRPPLPSAMQTATPNVLAFTTAFNEANGQSDLTLPRTVKYVYSREPGSSNGILYRYAYEGDLLSSFSRFEVIPHMLNTSAQGVFSYTYIDGPNRVTDAPSVPDRCLSTIQLVGVDAIVDLDPGKAPNGMEIETNAQVRNQRVIE